VLTEEKFPDIETTSELEELVVVTALIQHTVGLVTDVVTICAYCDTNVCGWFVYQPYGELWLNNAFYGQDCCRTVQTVL